MRQGIHIFPYFYVQLKTADNKYSNVMEFFLNLEDVAIAPNDHKVVTIQCQLYVKNAVTGILQPSEFLHEEGAITYCAAIITLTEGNVEVHVNDFTDQPYKPKKGLHIANSLVKTPEQMEHVKSIDPVFSWHLLKENEKLAIYYTSSLLKVNKNIDKYEQYCHPSPENRDEDLRNQEKRKN